MPEQRVVLNVGLRRLLAAVLAAVFVFFGHSVGHAQITVLGGSNLDIQLSDQVQFVLMWQLQEKLARGCVPSCFVVDGLESKFFQGNQAAQTPFNNFADRDDLDRDDFGTSYQFLMGSYEHSAALLWLGHNPQGSDSSGLGPDSGGDGGVGGLGGDGVGGDEAGGDGVGGGGDGVGGLGGDGLGGDGAGSDPGGSGLGPGGGGGGTVTGGSLIVGGTTQSGISLSLGGSGGFWPLIFMVHGAGIKSGDGGEGEGDPPKEHPPIYPRGHDPPNDGPGVPPIPPKPDDPDDPESLGWDSRSRSAFNNFTASHGLAHNAGTALLFSTIAFQANLYNLQGISGLSAGAWGAPSGAGGGDFFAP